MEVTWSMAASFVGLLLLTLLCPSWAGELPALTHLKDCGSHQVTCVELSEGCCFFVDQRAVAHDLFCGMLDSHVASGCLVQGSSTWEQWRRIRERHCRANSSSFSTADAVCIYLSEDLHRGARSKFLLQKSAQAPIFSGFSRKLLMQGVEHHKILALAPEKMVLASSGMLLLSCALLCPCFYAKKKAGSKHPIQGKEPNLMDSISSVDTSSTSERMPGTLLRVPASPLRVPPSPSRFSLSPQLSLSRIGSVHLSASQIARATQNFSPSHKIGEGGFGTVYKAILPEGQTVAVKRARKELVAALQTEFSNEVELLAKIEHRNLVKLLGYIDKGNERIIITEYVPNGTLREHLDGQHGRILNFNQRLEIAIDVAHALTYLHLYAEKTIIHRDVKSSNILLTESLRAKVADFGFARIGPADADQTHISTKVKGTAGYLDPEYLKTYQLTPKSDVFSFGILLIEILSGRRPVDLKKAPDERIAVKWAFKKYNRGNVKDLMDPLLEEEVDMEVLKKIFALAFRCAASTRADRPAMKEVVEQLWEIRKDYVRSLRQGSGSL
uniref:non-specific serine/threonine protein kinase n=1 Tax=Anthurium amnicola TaxID=1678845 RepID=A0A1D1YAV2_9ARAE